MNQAMEELQRAEQQRLRALEDRARAEAPDAVVFFVSGHTDYLFNNLPLAYPYLGLDARAGPAIMKSLKGAGYQAMARYYVDAPYAANGSGGFYNLISDLRLARSNFSRFGTRLIVVAHSHGGVWAHIALDGSDVPVDCLVDLDTSSFGWDFHLGTTFVTPRTGREYRDPRSIFQLPFSGSFPDQPLVPSASSYEYDIEDVVDTNVRYALEVRSGESFPTTSEWYDERWNIRVDGSTSNLWRHYSKTNHREVALSGSTTDYVNGWLLERLRDNGTQASAGGH